VLETSLQTTLYESVSHQTLPRRTNVSTLLAAAAALRAGTAPVSEGAFLVKSGFQVALAATNDLEVRKGFSLDDLSRLGVSSRIVHCLIHRY